MDTYFVYLPILFLLYAMTKQEPQNPAQVTEVTSHANCTTAKQIKGLCVDRGQCDYGTNAIDFTLYAPRGYKKTCSINEVCCPPEYILQIETQNGGDEAIDANK